LPLPFGLDSFEQFAVGSFEVVSEFQRGLHSFGIHLDPFSQFPGSRIVKEGCVIVQTRHDQLIAQLWYHAMRLNSRRTTDSSLRIGIERLHVGQLSHPAPETRGARAFFSCLAHDLKEQFNQ
jgi:hypothetical protein